VFYENAMGLRRGSRPAFNFPGAWLYRTTQNGDVVGGSVVHIVGIDPNDASGLSDYLGDKPLSLAPGSGSLDHIAFAATDIGAMYLRLKQQQIGFRERRVPNMELHQIFIEDPDGVTIELNYSRQEDISAGQRSLEAAAV
jgi:catechol 2,3-dioxygenase-like lactoylglutathione lyase family enzyme